MDNLPFEIWQRIFHLVSHRNRAICSRVCRRWHQLTFHPSYYATIEICSPLQLRKFLAMAKQTYMTMEIQQQPIVYAVHHIILYYEFERDEDFTATLLTEFPNIQSIQTTEMTDYAPLYIETDPPYPKLLKEVPFWFRMNDKEWMISFDKRKLVSFEYMINYQLPDDNTVLYLQSIGPIKTVKTRYAWLINNDNPDNPVDPDRPNNNNNINNNNNTNRNHQEGEEGLVSYQSKVLLLPTLSYLTTLKLAFIQHIPTSSVRLNRFELDERTLQSIHQSCQQLVTLHLYDFYMNISEDYIDDDDKKKRMDHTYPYVKRVQSDRYLI
ncbi:unnamed protein product [Cunninghamella blakesleeana]